MTATHFTGKHGEVQVGGNVVTVVEFNLDITTNVINDPRVGKKADKKYPGKQEYSGTITQTLITPVLLSYVIGDSNSSTTSTLETLLAVTDVSANAWSELAITSDPTAATSVKCTLTAGDASANAGSVVIRGTNSSDQIVTEVLDFATMAYGDAAQVIYGSQAFKTTDYIDVSGNLQPTPSSVSNTLKIEGIADTKTMSPGDPTYFDIIVKVEDANNNYVQATLSNCFFTGGNFPVGDSDTLVACVLPFVVHDADSDVSLVWTST